ncbi:hypothetical protein J8I29_07500 [Labrys sp. LIt4]|uniref:hypothetical protein n=1 Tax=Labrys sp. LIt4 TaxID=2821355 RepID=UPI001AE057C6|nr:hypothetical protein [Labrys sp. LIt4]MBP0579145.1 hypothetical protein [Labrys sp. LIt4]
MSIMNGVALRMKKGTALSSAAACCAVVLALAGAAPALAEPATAEGARKLTETFQSYIGPVPFEKGFITIAPKDDGYDVTLSFDGSKLDEAKGKGVAEVLRMNPYVVRLTPQSDGNWAVKSGPAPIAMAWSRVWKESPETGSFNFAACASQGMFVPKLMSFATLTVGCDGGAATVRNHDADIDLSTGKFGFMTSSEPDANDGVDVKFESQLQGLKGKVQDKKDTQFPVSFDLAGGQQTFSATGMRFAAIYDLVAFLREHPSKGQIVLAQDDLKTKLRAALPLWQEVSSTSQIEDLVVTLPFGQVKLGKARQAYGLTGLVKQGYYSDALNYSGLVIPEVVVPEWARSLVPAEANYATKLSLNGLDGMADVLIRGVDATQDPPFSKTMAVALMTRLLDGDLNYKIDFNVAAPAYTLKGNGSAAVNPEPTASLAVAATGFDAVVEGLSKANVEDARKAVFFLSFVKGLAKEEGNGQLVWNVSYDIVTHSVKVNDQVFRLPQPD